MNESTAHFRVHYWELSNYNAGRLVGKWFDLDGLTREEHLEEITKWLESLHNPDTGQACEEWILGDVENVPRDYLSTYDIDGSFFDLMAAMDASHLDPEVFEAAAELDIDPGEVEDRYQGEYSSDEEFAMYFAEEVMCVDLSRAHWPHSCIDWEYAARELMWDYCDWNNHYFSNY